MKKRITLAALLIVLTWALLDASPAWAGKVMVKNKTDKTVFVKIYGCFLGFCGDRTFTVLPNEQYKWNSYLSVGRIEVSDNDTRKVIKYKEIEGTWWITRDFLVEVRKDGDNYTADISEEKFDWVR